MPIRKDAPFWATVALQVMGMASSVPTFLLGWVLLARAKSVRQPCGWKGTGKQMGDKKWS